MKWFLIFLFFISNSTSLKLNKEGTFKIVQFTDLHYGANLDKKKDNSTSNLERYILDLEKPDLVVVTGDIISSEWWDTNQYQDVWTKKLWEKMNMPMIERNIPYAIIFGNHENDWIRDLILELELEYRPFSLTQAQHYNKNTGNFYRLTIEDSHNQPFTHLWFFDSLQYGCRHDPSSYGCPTQFQTEYFRSMEDGLPGIAFIHIPLIDFLDMWNSNESRIYGNMREDEKHGICCSTVQTGLFQVLKQGNVKAIYSGHDHSSDFYGYHQGVLLSYGRKTGYPLYGPHALHGARVLELNENGTIETWIRQADGSVEVQKLLKERKTMQYCCKTSLEISSKWYRIAFLTIVILVIGVLIILSMFYNEC